MDERRLRVLHYGLSTNPGGIENYLLSLARLVDRERFHFDFLYNDVGTPCYRDEFAAMGSEFFPMTPRRNSVRRNRADLEEIFGAHHFDILHFHVNTLSYVEPIRVALRHGCRVIVHSHNSGAPDSRVTRALHRWHRLTLPRDRVTRVAVSRLAGEWLFGLGSEFTVINNGIDVERFRFSAADRRRLRQELGLEDCFVVGNVAAFLYAKNHEFTLRVFAELLKQRPDSVLLLIGLGSLQEKIRVLADDLGVTDAVRFLGRRDDVPALMSAMDVFLLPSRYEGFPLVVLEAQAAGLPCLISDAITDEVVVFESCRGLSLNMPPDQWADAMPSQDRTSARSAAADQIAAAGFSEDAVARRVESLYVRASA